MFIYLCIFIVFTIAFVWLFQIVLLDDFYKLIKTNEIKSAAKEIAQNINDDDIDTKIRDIAAEKSLCVIISDIDGNIKYSEDKGIYCQIHRLQFSQRVHMGLTALENGGVFMQFFKTPFSFADNHSPDGIKPPDTPKPGKQRKEGLIYVSVIVDDNNQQTVIMLNSQITPVDATVNTLRVQLVCITVILIILAVILALIISRYITRPIIKINRSAKKLATSDYEVRFEENGYREISELAMTLNYAAEELGKTENLRKELVANVSHDLRTPLTMITGYSEVMRDLPGENTPENIQIIIDEAKRLTNLVNDMLDLSKLQSDTQVLDTDEFNLTDMIRKIIQRYSKLTEQNGYTIELSADKDVTVKGDRLKLSQVVYNLINNAVNYCGADKKVTVKQIVKDNGNVRVEVSDKGRGITEDEIPYVWDRYYKSKEAHKREIVGTGLGLSIVKKILELHSALYGVESSLNNGSTFWFELKI